MANEISLGNNYLNIQTSKNVELNEVLSLMTEEGAYDLEVKVIANFETIPERYHEVFINMMTVKYYGKVSFGDNPFSQCLPPKKKKWYQFWKQKI
jgi:hypothetical protein